MIIIIVLEPLKRVGDEIGRVVSLLLKVSGEPVKRSGTLKGTRSPPHAVDERGALNSMREERSGNYIIHNDKKNSLIKLTENNKFSIGGKEIKFNINIIK